MPRKLTVTVFVLALLLSGCGNRADRGRLLVMQRDDAAEWLDQLVPAGTAQA